MKWLSAALFYQIFLWVITYIYVYCIAHLSELIYTSQCRGWAVKKWPESVMHWTIFARKLWIQLHCRTRTIMLSDNWRFISPTLLLSSLLIARAMQQLCPDQSYKTAIFGPRENRCQSPHLWLFVDASSAKSGLRAHSFTPSLFPSLATDWSTCLKRDAWLGPTWSEKCSRTWTLPACPPLSARKSTMPFASFCAAASCNSRLQLSPRLLCAEQALPQSASYEETLLDTELF